MTPSLFVRYITERSKTSEENARVAIWKAYDKRSYKRAMDLPTDEYASLIYEIIRHFDFLDTPDTRSTITSFDGTRSYFKRHMLYFPEPYMEHSSVLEFAIADDAYEAIIQAVQDEDVDSIKKYSKRLLAILARPLSGDTLLYIKTGDRRIPLLSLSHAKYLKDQITTRKLPIYMHQAIIYFTAVKKWINETYGEGLFPSSGSSSAGTVTSDLKWHAHVAAVAEQGVFGHHVDEVYQQNIHRFLRHLISKKEEFERNQPTNSQNT